MGTSYTIRPAGRGFGIYRGRTIFGRMREVAYHDRLWDAEQHCLSMVTQDYHKELDYRRITNQTMSTDMMLPRQDEEHLYTALLLAGKKPRDGDDMENEARFHPVDDLEFRKYDNILEPHFGKPISHTTRVMFEERFLTWYGAHHPTWVDPRRERTYNPASDRYERNRYAGVASPTGGPPPPTAIKRWLASLGARVELIQRALFGPTPITKKEIEAASQAISAR